jgi:hypothetical protein
MTHVCCGGLGDEVEDLFAVPREVDPAVVAHLQRRLPESPPSLRVPGLLPLSRRVPSSAAPSPRLES